MTEEIRFCPHCGSEDVQIKITPTLVLGMPQNWVCNKCGYTNLIFPVKVFEVKLKKLKNDAKKN